MDKYALMNRCHYGYGIKVYMYYFMYVDTETISQEDYFPATKTFVENTRGGQLRDQCQKIGLDLDTLVHKIMSQILTLMKHK